MSTQYYSVVLTTVRVSSPLLQLFTPLLCFNLYSIKHNVGQDQSEGTTTRLITHVFALQTNLERKFGAAKCENFFYKCDQNIVIVASI